MAKKENKTNKEKKHFWKDYKAEIKKVIWPTPKQLINSTVAIITMVLVVTVIVFVLDLAFDAFNKYALTNLQEAVQPTTSDESSENSSDEASDSSKDIEDSSADAEVTNSEEATAEENKATETGTTTENAGNAENTATENQQ